MIMSDLPPKEVWTFLKKNLSEENVSEPSCNSSHYKTHRKPASKKMTLLTWGGVFVALYLLICILGLILYELMPFYIYVSIVLLFGGFSHVVLNLKNMVILLLMTAIPFSIIHGEISQVDYDIFVLQGSLIFIGAGALFFLKKAKRY